MKQERGIVRLILPQGDLFLLNMMPTMRPIRRKIKRLGLKRRRETDRRCTESFCRRFDLSLRPGRVLYGHGTLKDKDRKEDSLHLQDKAGNDQTDDKEICASGSEAAQAHRAWANDLFEDRLSGKCLPRDT